MPSDIQVEGIDIEIITKEILYASALIDKATKQTFDPAKSGAILVNGETPIDIQMACKMIVEERLSSVNGRLRSDIQSESVDDASYSKFGRTGFGCITGIPEVEAILNSYRKRIFEVV